MAINIVPPIRGTQHPCTIDGTLRGQGFLVVVCSLFKLDYIYLIN